MTDLIKKEILEDMLKVINVNFIKLIRRFDRDELVWLSQTEQMASIYLKNDNLEKAEKYIKILFNIINRVKSGESRVVHDYM